MEEGYVLDSIATHSNPEIWTEGKKPQSVWAKLIKGDKRSFEVVTYRCVSCGYLESYATAEK